MGQGRSRLQGVIGQRWPGVGERSLWWGIALIAAAMVALVSAIQLLMVGVADPVAGTAIPGATPAASSGFGALLARQGLAALAWIPIGAAVVQLARRHPLRRHRLPATLAIHAAAILATAAAVNVLIPALWWTAGVPFGAFGAVALDGFVRHLHVNALVYAVVSGATQVVVRRQVVGRQVAGRQAVGRQVVGRQIVRHRTRSADNRGAETASDQTEPDRLAVPEDDGMRMVDVGSIRWIEGAGDYARIHLPARSHLIAERMFELERRLDPARFVRVHRSAIVRLGAVREIRPAGSGGAIAVLDDAAEVRVSRRRKKALLERLRDS